MTTQNRIFPDAKENEKKSGWKISLDFLHKIQNLLGDKAEREGHNSEYITYPSPEEIENILVLAEEALSMDEYLNRGN